MTEHSIERPITDVIDLFVEKVRTLKRIKHELLNEQEEIGRRVLYTPDGTAIPYKTFICGDSVVRVTSHLDPKSQTYKYNVEVEEAEVLS